MSHKSINSDLVLSQTSNEYLNWYLPFKTSELNCFQLPCYISLMSFVILSLHLLFLLQVLRQGRHLKNGSLMGNPIIFFKKCHILIKAKGHLNFCRTFPSCYVSAVRNCAPSKSSSFKYKTLSKHII